MSARGAAAAPSKSCLAADNRSSLLCKRRAINSVRTARASHGLPGTCAMKGIDAILPSARCFHHERSNVRWPSLNGSPAIWNGKGLEQATYCEEMSGCSINGHRRGQRWRFNERSDRGLAKASPVRKERGVRCDENAAASCCAPRCSRSPAASACRSLRQQAARDLLRPRPLPRSCRSCRRGFRPATRRS